MVNRKQVEEEKPTFEASMERLEEIVEQMECADLPLDQIIEKYEEGMKLVRVCEGKLKEAEEKIECLTQNKAGKVTVRQLDSEDVEQDGGKQADLL